LYKFAVKKTENITRKFWADSFYDPKVIDQRIIKSSVKRLVISGNRFEMYSYAKPFHYNFPPQTRAFRGQELTATPILPLNDIKRRESNLNACRQRIRRLVQSNAGMYREITKFVTFTFKENVIDLAYANNEFRKFIKRFNYNRCISSKYLVVVEFQKRGAIHYHVLFFNLPYIDRLAILMQKIWGHGNVDVRAISHVENIGAYITKYLQKNVFDARLSREKAFFCSKGLLQPVEIKDSKNLAIYLKKCTLDIITTKEYRSSYYGDIIYKCGYIKNI